VLAVLAVHLRWEGHGCLLADLRFGRHEQPNRDEGAPRLLVLGGTRLVAALDRCPCAFGWACSTLEAVSIGALLALQFVAAALYQARFVDFGGDASGIARGSEEVVG